MCIGGTGQAAGMNRTARRAAAIARWRPAAARPAFWALTAARHHGARTPAGGDRQGASHTRARSPSLELSGRQLTIFSKITRR